MAGIDIYSKTVAAEGDWEDHKVIVLLVDRRPWTRAVIGRALESTDRTLQVLRFADASELAQAGTPDGPAIILLVLTAADCLERAVSTARSRLPGLPVVALCDTCEAERVLQAIALGLSGYIPISLDLHQAIGALHFVAAGGTFAPAEALLADLVASSEALVEMPEQMPVELSVELPEELPDPPPPTPTPTLAPASLAVRSQRPPEAVVAPTDDASRGKMQEAAQMTGRPRNSLTPRELAVLEGLRQGKSNKQIALDLDLREATVKIHVHHIMRKMGVANRTQVALMAERFTES